jgi:uncharacterized glyoxalase superfamily protein PhnB
MTRPEFGPATPIFRIFDEAKAREFYVDFLGFTVEFEHRFEPGMPLYLGLSMGECRLHLSEHYGDGSPNARVRIETPDVDAYQQRLLAKKFKFARPGVEEQPWGSREMTISDPFDNRLTFYSRTSSPSLPSK